LASPEEGALGWWHRMIMAMVWMGTKYPSHEWERLSIAEQNKAMASLR